MKLSAQTARELEPGGVLRDHEVKGLQLRAWASGKSWTFYYRNRAGERRQPKLGDYPAISLDAARKLARELAERVARGEDPSAAKQAYRASPAVSELAAAYMEEHRAGAKPRTIEENERRLKLHILPQLGALKVADVEYTDIAKRLDAIAAASGPVCANRVRSLLSGLFAYAEHDARKWRPRGSNPVADTGKRPERPRRRKMEPAEFVRVAKALDQYALIYPRQIAVVRVALLAGTRITELATAKWRDLEGGNKIIRHDHKTQRTGEVREIVLPAQALEVMRALPTDPEGYIFGAGMNRYSVRTVWEIVRGVAGVPDLRVQDMRRTFASVALSSGFSLDLIGQLFGHRSTDTTRGYSWLETEAAETAAQRTADVISKRMAG